MNDDRSDDPKPSREFAYGRSWQEYLARETGPGEESEEEAKEEEPAPEDPAAGAREPEAERTPDEPGAEDAASDETDARPEARTGGRERAEEQPKSSRVVVPPEEERAREGVGRTRRVRRLTGVLAVLALAVAALVVPRLLSSNGEAGAGGVDAPAAGSGAESDRQPSTERQVALISARSDSVAEAVARFRERRSDFDLNRIGCDGLARGLREVRTAFSRLTAALEPVRDRVGVSASARYQRLSDDVSGVERSFAATGCTASS